MILKAFEERRQHERYTFNKKPTLLLSPTTVISYGVLDISDSGLAFVYMGWENWFKKEIKLDIIDEDFYLEDIPICIIEDVKLEDGSNTLKALRRCGVQFTDLRADQKVMLKKYIEYVAVK